MLVAAGAVTTDYAEAMREREASVSTYMGNLLAIPHGTNESKGAILDSALSVARYDEPLDWDGNPVKFVVGIAGKDGGHLEILSKIAIVFASLDPPPGKQSLWAMPGVGHRRTTANRTTITRFTGPRWFRASRYSRSRARCRSRGTSRGC